MDESPYLERVRNYEKEKRKKKRSGGEGRENNSLQVRHVLEEDQETKPKGETTDCKSRYKCIGIGRL